MQRLLGILLIVEAAWRVPGIAGIVYTMATYDLVADVLIAARVVVTALQLTAGSLLLRRRPPAVPLALAALVSSAALLTLEAGFRLAPSGVYSFWRWQVVAAYAVYALVGVLILRRGT